MWGEYVVISLIASLFTLLAVSAVWIRVTRRYSILSNSKVQAYELKLSEKILLLKEKKIALRELFYQVHHHGPRPAMASVLGLSDLYWRESKCLGENLVLLSRENHHRYGGLSIKQITNMDEYMRKIEFICKKLHQSTVEAVSQFEHLQE